MADVDFVKRRALTQTFGTGAYENRGAMRDRSSDTAHRRAAEAMLRRKLAPDEVVHHANEDKADNSPINLNVKRRSVHSAGHNRTRSLSKLRASLRMVREKKRLY